MGSDQRRGLARTARISARLVVAGAAIIAPVAGCASGSSGAAPVTVFDAGCYDNTLPGQPDILYSGTPNVVGNVTLKGTLPITFSFDGTCAGPDTMATGTVVRAFDVGTATTLCQSLVPTSPGASNLLSKGFAVPTDVWGC